MRKISKIEPLPPSAPVRKRVAAYARISEEKGRTMLSLAAQVSFYSDFIQKHGEWEYAGVYADSGLSGTTGDREEFKRLLADCDAGKIEILSAILIQAHDEPTVFIEHPQKKPHQSVRLFSLPLFTLSSPCRSPA